MGCPHDQVEYLPHSFGVDIAGRAVVTVHVEILWCPACDARFWIPKTDVLEVET